MKAEVIFLDGKYDIPHIRVKVTSEQGEMLFNHSGVCAIPREMDMTREHIEVMRAHAMRALAVEVVQLIHVLRKKQGEVEG